ncbi:flagellar motor stator protein MotA [Polaromonas sp. CG_23.6]|uniref:flagellar motor stator protein MotA n=1 Tax=unclassified Polaromonas TaxID=2638319 RepID=UPI0018C9274D|nr:flagellar motor stator protein MotA [Polaromonas sp. CG_23.6]MBG6070502.1 chemotaxis protein MotA [Polaromonas sp. CG_9.7]MBG6112500.1 chemotaxis protein MotA [Polaromonas sp. CG_9.2]MDH6184150.1 chemotaxis protein MotA [Polaromonas sp. CG_23.6]
MLVILGYGVVLASVFGGYGLMGGHFGVLYQPLEVLIIVGAAVGAFIAGNDGKTIRSTLKVLPKLLKNSKKHDKALFMELLALLYMLLSKGRKDGLMSLESDVDDPHNSPIFAPYPVILADARVLEFMTDYLRLMVSGNTDPHEIGELMEQELETYKHEGEIPAHSLTRVGDALPALGIVAAVLGVVHALASADLPPAQMGQLIAHAMVGTFLGILLAYGFVMPLATLVEHKVAESLKVYQCIRITLLASLNGYAPQLAVEFGRKVLTSTHRPSFSELDGHVRDVKGRANAQD